MRIFLYGTLCHLPLLRVVLGRNPDAIAAQLSDHGVVWAAGENYPILRVEPGATCDGIVVTVSDGERERLDFYEGPFGYALRPVMVTGSEGALEAQVYWPASSALKQGARWSLADWERDWAEIVTQAASEVMAAFGQQSAEAVARRSTMILGRAQAYVNTKAWDRPRSIGRRIGAENIQMLAHAHSYLGFFTLEDMTVTHPRFDGGAPITVDRAVFRVGEAATLLPYDPARDRVLLVEQFRPAPFAHGDQDPWLLEPVAGLCDPGETPAETARREAKEEAGVSIGELHFVARYYPSPGATAQVLHSYVGIADLPDDLPRSGGLADEGEDIALHLVSFARAMDAMQSGEIVVAPLIMSLQWLAAYREVLRGGA
ncbi:MAG: NUDIX domain-containing protein [Pseudomonadota bacterium]